MAGGHDLHPRRRNDQGPPLRATGGRMLEEEEPIFSAYSIVRTTGAKPTSLGGCQRRSRGRRGGELWRLLGASRSRPLRVVHDDSCGLMPRSRSLFIMLAIQCTDQGGPSNGGTFGLAGPCGPLAQPLRGVRLPLGRRPPGSSRRDMVTNTTFRPCCWRVRRTTSRLLSCACGWQQGRRVRCVEMPDCARAVVCVHNWVCGRHMGARGCRERA
ncbi:hypothetical protein K466DRAFT_72219 [Polyporus arcularius HHB13444]|uniref:Uncharacterized protein n=1 Tax=Polyporus arcularius HHB13444 TaxID=1314778 RepID=A0A5C3PY92_9APHY|nr:hypothetical protein K466DRAFT_72219 [Polyporus arcularius HHB13444]